MLINNSFVSARAFITAFAITALPNAALAQANRRPPASPPQRSAQAPANNRPVVAIYEMRDLANTGQAAALSVMIETAITSTNKFRVIEGRFDQLLAQQGKANTGLVTTNRPGRVGGFEGADFLIYGSITGIGVAQRGNAGATFLRSMLGGNNATPDCANTIATLSMDVKITDAVTGEVRYNTRINEQQRAEATCGAAGSIDNVALMRLAADKVATGLVTSIYPIQIASVQPDGTYVLNYGEGAVGVGDIMVIYDKGEEIRDPTTGSILGSDETLLGYIQVSAVQSRLSRAVAVSPFATQPSIGAIVRKASDAELAKLRNTGKKRKS